MKGAYKHENYEMQGEMMSDAMDYMDAGDSRSDAENLYQELMAE